MEEEAAPVKVLPSRVMEVQAGEMSARVRGDGGKVAAVNEVQVFPLWQGPGDDAPRQRRG